MLTGIAVGLTLVVGTVAGRQFDRRYQSAVKVLSDADESRASMNLANALAAASQNAKQGIDAQQEILVQRQIEERSGVRGNGVFSAEPWRQKWQPQAPVLRDGVEVSGLLGHEFHLRRSEVPGFILNRVALQASFTRPRTYLEVGMGDGPNGAYIARIENGVVTLMFRSVSGTYVSIARAEAPACKEFSIELRPSAISIQCDDREISLVPINGANVGRVFASTNLVREEVERLVLFSRVGETEVEDAL